MLALAIILVVTILILLIPVGAKLSFIDGELAVSARVWLFGIGIIPSSGKKPTKKKPPREKKPAAEKPAKPKQKLTREDIIGIARLALRALGRLRRGLSIDRLMLHLTVAADDPFDAVVNYGRINAALGAALPLLHRVVKIKNEDIGTQLSFETDKTTVDAVLQATLQIWEILYIGLCAGAGFLVWLLKRKKRARAETAQAAVQKG